MKSRMLGGLTVALIMGISSRAEDPKFPDEKAFDKSVVESLRDVHNKGADLYNEFKDYVGAYRVYQGALLSIRPLLSHRPAAQKLVDDGLAAAERDSSVQSKAFKLHETIEAVRMALKNGGVLAVKSEGTKKTGEKKPMDTSETTKPPQQNPLKNYEVAPQPREKKSPV
jgi:hypothetical protein